MSTADGSDRHQEAGKAAEGEEQPPLQSCERAGGALNGSVGHTG